VSEQSIITIDLSNKTGQFEYINLKTPLNSIDFAVSGLKNIDDANKFDDYFSQLTLTSTKIYKSRNGLNATLKFSFKNKNNLLDLLYFYTSPNGNLEYRILECEKIISSNGKLSKQDEFYHVQWDNETRRIELKLKHRKLKDQDFDQMVSLLNYWKE